MEGTMKNNATKEEIMNKQELNGIDPNYELSEKEKNEMKELIQRDMKDVKLDVLKSILREKNIDFDDSISSYEELKKSVKASVGMEKFSEIATEEEVNNKEITQFLSALENDGAITPQKLFNDFKNMVIKPTAKSVATIGLSRALFDAMVFLPSPVRTIAGVAALGATVFKGVKGQLDKFRAQETERYDNVLETLKTKKDEDGNAVLKEYSSAQIAEINKFLEEKGVETKDISYNSMSAEVDKLKNKDKLELINRINDVSDNKLDIKDELRKERKIQKAKAGKKNLLRFGLGAALGIVGANLDKEVVDLVNPLVSREAAEATYQMRTGYSPIHDPVRSLVPYGLLGTSAVSLLTNMVGFIGKTVKDRKDSKNYIQKEGDVKLSTNQKLVLDILKTKLLEGHPEDKDKIGDISTLNEFKSYTSGISKKEQDSMKDLIVKLNTIVKSKDAKTQATELAKMLGNSALLAGNSILAYQILLFLKNNLVLWPPTLGGGAPGQGELQPQKQPAYATATENAYATNPATESVVSTVPATQPVMQPTPVPGKTPVTNPGLSPAPVPGRRPGIIPPGMEKVPNPGVAPTPLPSKKPGIVPPGMDTIPKPGTVSQGVSKATETVGKAVSEGVKPTTGPVPAVSPRQLPEIDPSTINSGGASGRGGTPGFEAEPAPTPSYHHSYDLESLKPDFTSGAWPATFLVTPIMMFEMLWGGTRKLRGIAK